MAADNGATLPLIEEEEPIRQYGDIEASDRRRRKDLDRESARAVKGGATRGLITFISYAIAVSRIQIQNIIGWQYLHCHSCCMAICVC